MDTSDSAGPAAACPLTGPAGPPLKIFINYRHEDMPFAALTLYRELKGRFGKENIFFDEGTLRPGMRFLGGDQVASGRHGRCVHRADRVEMDADHDQPPAAR